MFFINNVIIIISNIFLGFKYNMQHIINIITWSGFILHWLLVSAVTVRIMLKRRAVGISLAWLMVVFLIPVLGIAAYFMFGEHNLGRKRARRSKRMLRPYENWFKKLGNSIEHQHRKLGTHANPLHNLCYKRMFIPALTGHQLELLTTPESIINSMIADVNLACESIRAEFYIWQPGGLADKMAQALIDAKKRGVKIAILLDAAGSKDFFKSTWPDKFKAAKIPVRAALRVSPMRALFRRLDLRLHRKIFVVDNKVAYTGSMNMIDPKYFKQDKGIGEWIDIMVRIYGPSASLLNCIQSWDWEVETGYRHFPMLPKRETYSSSVLSAIQVIPSGPGMPEQIIQQVLLLAIYQAKESIIITTPYFVPSDQLIFAIITAAERGIKVKLIVPFKNDSTMVQWASQSYFAELLAAGVEIYCFNNGLLHTKSVLVDDEYCLIGTVNLDMRSLWLNFEVTIAIDDLTLCQELKELIYNYIAQSKKIDKLSWSHRSWKKRLLEQFFYIFAPLL